MKEFKTIFYNKLFFVVRGIPNDCKYLKNFKYDSFNTTKLVFNVN